MRHATKPLTERDEVADKVDREDAAQVDHPSFLLLGQAWLGRRHIFVSAHCDAVLVMLRSAHSSRPC